MNEDYFLRCRVYAWIGWAVVLALIVSAWAVMVVGVHEWRIAFLLGGSGCAMSAVAATLHIRSFMVRVCSLVRAASYKPVDGEGLRPVG